MSYFLVGAINFQTFVPFVECSDVCGKEFASLLVSLSALCNLRLWTSQIGSIRFDFVIS